MVRKTIKRRPLVGLLGLTSFALLNGRAGMAAALPAPKGTPILTISGKIRNTNHGDEAELDRDMIESLGMTSIQTATPWYKGVMTFEGVLMTKLLDYVGADGTEVTAVALNDYSTVIPISDFSTFGVLLALKRNGEYMPVRDKGPLFIVYPFDSKPELQQQKYYSRAAWQLSRLVVR